MPSASRYARLDDRRLSVVATTDVVPVVPLPTTRDWVANFGEQIARGLETREIGIRVASNPIVIARLTRLIAGTTRERRFVALVEEIARRIAVGARALSRLSVTASLSEASGLHP